MMQRTHLHRPSRGGILFEVMVSIVLFVGAGSIVLGVTSNMLNRKDIQLRHQQATDIARSLMAMLEMGAISIDDVRSGLPRRLGSNEWFSAQVDERMERGLIGWSADIETQRTEYAGLVLVELTVYEERGGFGQLAGGLMDADSDLISVSVHQLMRVRHDDFEEFQLDDMVEGLPMSRTGRAGGRSR